MLNQARFLVASSDSQLITLFPIIMLLYILKKYILDTKHAPLQSCDYWAYINKIKLNKRYNELSHET